MTERRRLPRKPAKAVCKICGQKFYMKTRNVDGKIICLNCDNRITPWESFALAEQKEKLARR